jgi:protein-disulfide isomerase
MRRPLPSLERVFGWTIAAITSLAAASVGAAAVHREFIAPRAAGAAPERRSEYVPSWKELIPAGHLVGSPVAPVKILEFADLECPFCREFNRTVRAILRQYPKTVAYVFIHRPLHIHRFARPAARAAECAGMLGRFNETADLLYEKQDSLGLKSWVSYARDAGVQDTVRFAQCLTSSADSAIVTAPIDSGVRVADAIGVHATPTVILNGWRFGQPPSDTELVRAIRDLLAGKRPYSDFPLSR